MTEPLLERAQRILEGVSPEPWVQVGFGNIHVEPVGEHPPVAKTWNRANGEFIAASRTLISELTEALRAAQERVVELEDHDVCCEWCGGGCSRERRWAERVEGS